MVVIMAPPRGDPTPSRGGYGLMVSPRDDMLVASPRGDMLMASPRGDMLMVSPRDKKRIASPIDIVIVSPCRYADGLTPPPGYANGLIPRGMRSNSLGCWIVVLGSPVGLRCGNCRRRKVRPYPGGVIWLPRGMMWLPRGCDVVTQGYDVVTQGV